MLNFPDAPALNDTFDTPLHQFIWLGDRWKRNGVPPPYLLSLVPDEVFINTDPVSFSAIGTSFQDGCEVEMDGVAVPTAFVDSTRVTVTGPVSAVVKTAQVVVVNPDGGRSVALPFDYVLPGPVLTALVPDNGPLHSATISVSLQGRYFTAASVARFDGADVPTVFVSDVELTATPPLSTTEKTVYVYVADPTGVSAELDFSYVQPIHPPGTLPPLISGVIPNQIFKSQGLVTVMVVNGLQFEAGTRVLLNGVPEGFCVVQSATSLTWTLDHTNLPAGQYTINLETPPIQGTNPDIQFYISS